LIARWSPVEFRYRRGAGLATVNVIKPAETLAAENEAAGFMVTGANRSARRGGLAEREYKEESLARMDQQRFNRSSAR